MVVTMGGCPGGVLPMVRELSVGLLGTLVGVLIALFVPFCIVVLYTMLQTAMGYSWALFFGLTFVVFKRRSVSIQLLCCVV